MDFWGQHLILDCSGCDYDLITSKTNIEAFVKKLVNDIEMEAYGEPMIVHFGHDNKEGYTLVQLISTSNISAHFANESNAAYIDVFSCKSFCPDVVKRVVNQFFAPKKIRETLLTRNAD
jgi:S-adenosylmethionine/arginine decarboxylase-like enzyme